MVEEKRIRDKTPAEETSYLHGSLQDARVDGGHTIHSVGPHDSQVGHVQSLLWNLFHN